MLYVAVRLERRTYGIGAGCAAFGVGAYMAKEVGEEGFEGWEAGSDYADVHFDSVVAYSQWRYSHDWERWEYTAAIYSTNFPYPTNQAP